MRPLWIFIALLSGPVSLHAAEAVPGDPITDVYAAGERIAQKIDAILGGRTLVHVQSFNTFGGKNIGISQAIADSLKELGHVLSSRPDVEIEGRLFRQPDDPNLPITGYKVTGNIVFRVGKAQPFEVVVKNEREARAFTGKMGQFIPSPFQVANFTPDSNPESGPEITNGWVRPVKGSAYAVRVVVKRADGALEVRTPALRGGEPHVRLERGERYAIQLFNASPYESAASIFIDGLSRYSTSDDPDHRKLHDVVPATLNSSQGLSQIDGYFKNFGENFEFKVFEPSQALVTRIAPQAAKELGTIAVTFSAIWQDGQELPPHEPRAAKVLAKANDPQRPKAFTTRARSAPAPTASAFSSTEIQPGVEIEASSSGPVTTALPAAPAADFSSEGPSAPEPASPAPDSVSSEANVAVGSGPGENIQTTNVVRLNREVGAVRAVVKLRYFASR